MKKNIPQTLLLGIVFLMAFCSFSYEILIASRLSRLLSGGYFVYPGCISLFILFMGLGSSQWFRRKPLDEEETLSRLLGIEMLLTVGGLVCVYGINGLGVESFNEIHIAGILFGIGMAGWIGYLSGQELPLIFHFSSLLHLGQRGVRRMIFFDYAASFAASVTCLLVFFPLFGLFRTSVLISFFNLVVVLLLTLIFRRRRIPLPRRAPKKIAALLISYLVIGIFLTPIERYVLTYYLGERKGVLLDVLNTRYQQVLLFLLRKDNEPVRHSGIEEVRARPGDYYLCVTLNGSVQFFEQPQISADPYHTFMFDPFMRILPGIKDVLILGGGDGLPARQAVQYDQIRHITMVDIDPQWVSFARKNPYLRLLHGDSFRDPRLEIRYADAFQWIIRTDQTFDAVMVDFPAELESLAAIRTRSLQFMRDLRRILNPGGAIVLQWPDTSSDRVAELTAKTAQLAGLYPLLGREKVSRSFDQIEQMVLFRDEKTRSLFLRRYASYTTSRPVQVMAEKFGLLAYQEVPEAEEWISYYDPFVSSLPWREKAHLLKEEFFE